MAKKSFMVIFLIVLSIFVLLNPVKSSAYVLNKQKMANPKSINYFNDSSIIKESSIVT